MDSENIDLFKNMIQTYKNMLDDLEESDMKEQFKNFVYSIMSNSTSFETVLKVLDTLIKNSTLSTYNDIVYPSGFANKFWKKVRDIFINTYNETNNNKK